MVRQNDSSLNTIDWNRLTPARAPGIHPAPGVHLPPSARMRNDQTHENGDIDGKENA